MEKCPICGEKLEKNVKTFDNDLSKLVIIYTCKKCEFKETKLEPIGN